MPQRRQGRVKKTERVGRGLQEVARRGDRECRGGVPSSVFPSLWKTGSSRSCEDAARGSGTDRGNEYIDGLASLWYCHVGHGREEIAEGDGRAGAHPGRLPRVLSVLPTSPPNDSATGSRRSPGSTCARVFLTDSGSEAVDTAVKLVRLACRERGDRDRTLIVTREDAYHGVTYGGTSAQGLPFEPRGLGRAGAEASSTCRAADWIAARALFAERGREIAAVLTEPVQAAGGVHPPEPGYLEGLRALCDEQRRAAGFRRGRLRLRPDRRVVRLPALRRPARRGDLRQGRDLGATSRWAGSCSGPRS